MQVAEREPIAVEDDDGIGRLEVDPETTSSCREQERKVRGARSVESLDRLLPNVRGNGTLIDVNGVISLVTSPASKSGGFKLDSPSRRWWI